MNRRHSRVLPVLPVRNIVLFPSVMLSLSAARPASLAAVQAAVTAEDKEIIVVAQRSPTEEMPSADDLYSVGTKAVIRRMLPLADHAMSVMVQGIDRIQLESVVQLQPCLMMEYADFPIPSEDTAESEALQRSVLEAAGQMLGLSQLPNAEELQQALQGLEKPMDLVFLLASSLPLDIAKTQSILEARTQEEGLRLMHTFLLREKQIMEIRSKIAKDVQSEISREQREYVLRQQMKAIQHELGDKSQDQQELDLLEERLRNEDLPEEVRKEGLEELDKLRKLPTMAPDYHVLRTYLDFLLGLPWKTCTTDQLDLANARQILEDDHYNLKEVKERILEHLGVLKLNPSAKAPILCFVGPPGVGKTSLGQSIARAMGRKFERMSLGGLHDEAELRGHRRTYIGAMPGRILKAIHRAGVNNPLLMLDEVDKLGKDFRGDPASALLEVLDPEQNRAFHDNYVDVPFDLSHTFFITTANTTDTIPQPLLDRMEMLRLSGYTEEEKLQIAIRYLVPRQLKETGIGADQLQYPEATLRRIISRYTREAGVRNLERTIARVARRIALRFAESGAEFVEVRVQDLDVMLGPEPFFVEEARQVFPKGVAAGLAWTEAGGEVLYVEAALLPGTEGLTLTGHLGDVMQESARTAHSYLWSHAAQLGIRADAIGKSGVHVHVPAGATPKDGPSAGLTMLTALVSLYSGRPARSDTAMTGEITLTGLVLPVGGVREKVLAAHRAGILRVILPRSNEKDLRDLPPEIHENMEFIYVEKALEAIQTAIPIAAEALEFAVV